MQSTCSLDDEPRLRTPTASSIGHLWDIFKSYSTSHYIRIPRVYPIPGLLLLCCKIKDGNDRKSHSDP